jgi:hypothetical protein
MGLAWVVISIAALIGTPIDGYVALVDVVFYYSNVSQRTTRCRAAGVVEADRIRRCIHLCRRCDLACCTEAACQRKGDMEGLSLSLLVSLPSSRR